MTYPEVLLIGVAVAYLGLSGYATARIFADDLSTNGQKAGQLLFTWLLPIIGALVTIQLKRKHLERGEVRYPERQPLEEDIEFSKDRGRRDMESAAED